MKSVNLNNQTYRIGFGYNRPADKSQQETIAFIKNMDTDVVITGISRCSKRDNFEKEVGRKLALKRALESSPFNKEERSAIWEVYETRKAHK